MNLLYELFEHSTDAVFGISPGGYVCYWNGACEKLMGISRNEAKDEKCASLLCGNDLQGNRFCGSNCPIPRKVGAKAQAGRNFDLMVKRANGDEILVNIGAYYVPTDWQKRHNGVSVFFSLRRVNCQQLLQRMASESCQRVTGNNGNGAGQYDLTPREMEVLELAGAGYRTDQIAQRLSISKVTVGNHFKNIYPKFGVHSKTGAVSFALRHNLIQ